MTYLCEIGTGQRVYLDNAGTQTSVTIASSGPGQQQQSGSSFPTGSWTAPPEAFRIAEGIVIKLRTAEGEHFIRIQGSSMSALRETPSLSTSQQLQMQQVASPPSSFKPFMKPMEPMEPMKPMKPMEPMEPMKPMNSAEPMTMGDMEMSMNPMQMRMGNLEMRMGSPNPATTVTNTRQFCTQCGTAVSPSDRFCASCGHHLLSP